MGHLRYCHLTRGYWGHTTLTQAQGQSQAHPFQAKAQVITSLCKYQPIYSRPSFSILGSTFSQDPGGSFVPEWLSVQHSLSSSALFIFFHLSPEDMPLPYCTCSFLPHQLVSAPGRLPLKRCPSSLWTCQSLSTQLVHSCKFVYSPPY